MGLAAWLGGSLSVGSFRERILGVQAYAGLGLAADACALLDWAAFPRLLASVGPAHVDVINAGRTRPCTGALDVDGVRTSLDSGLGLRVRSTATLHDGLDALLAAFEDELACAASLQLWAMPRRTAGLGWRRSSADLFIAQTAGSQEHYFGPDVARAPRRRVDGQKLRLPPHVCTLEAGDWLYVPRGWWHRTEAIEDALAMTIEITRPWALRAPDAVQPPPRHAVPSSPPSAIFGSYVVRIAEAVATTAPEAPAHELYRSPLRLLHPYARS